MLNLYLGIIAITVCTYVGYKSSAKFTLRRTFLQDWVNFNNLLKTEVAFSHNSLKKLLETQSDGKFNTLLKDNLFEQPSDESKRFFDKSKILQSTEKQMLASYFSTIGKSDAKSELLYVSGIGERLKPMLDKAVEDEKKFRSLYMKLGFACGLVILVLVI